MKEKRGDYTYGSVKILGEHLLDEFIIGKFCSIGPEVSALIKGWEHNPDWVTTYPFKTRRYKGHGSDWEKYHKIELPIKTPRSLVIGNDVWIGQGVMLIVDDIIIGDGAIIGAQAVVTKDVSPYTVVTGNPGASQRLPHNKGRSYNREYPRFGYEQILKLLEMKWWDWPIDYIQRAIHLITSRDIPELWDYFLTIRKELNLNAEER